MLRATHLALLALALHTYAHGTHEAEAQQPLQPHAQDALDAAAASNDWMTAHMALEHRLTAFDASSFFALHDYDADGRWEPAEILRTYGCGADSSDGMGGLGAHMPGAPDQRPTADKQAEVLAQVLSLFDADSNGFISRDEWTQGHARGTRLPDFGMGSGHHRDPEIEYELHHWLKYHDESTREEDLTHPEDIAHFRIHDEMEAAEAKQAALDRMNVVEANIPAKFRRVR